MKVSNHTTHCIQCNKELKGKQVHFCSKQCKSKKHQYNSYESQQKRGEERKKLFIIQKGGSCIICGYNRNYSALCFHHKNPKNKSFNLDLRSLSNRSISVCQKEIDKCDLLCHNCHFELHNPNCTL